MKLLGQILLWAGFLAGSLATVFNSPAAGVAYVKKLTPEQLLENRVPEIDLSAVELPIEGWNLIPWNWYIPSAIVCVVGIVLLRLGRSAEGQKTEKTQASLAEIVSSLQRVIDRVSQLSAETGTLAPSKIAARIENDLADDLRIFADGRDSITAEFGLGVFADVMSQFAAGERSVNRAWSAAADGYVDEAATCIERAEAMFREAALQLEQAEAS